jgi:hypothetical protein
MLAGDDWTRIANEHSPLLPEEFENVHGGWVATANQLVEVLP